MIENLSEIKKNLVKAKLAEKHSKMIQQIRKDIIELAILDAELDDINSRDQYIQFDTTKILQEIANTNWPTLTTTTYSFINIAMMGEDILQCKRCQGYDLVSNVPDESEELCAQCSMEAFQERRRLGQERERNEIVACKECGNKHPRYLLQTNPHYHTSSNVYCQPCLDRILQLFQRTCAICNIDYTAPDHAETFDLCSKCRTPLLTKEGRRVYHHNYRATSANLPATLTYKQWIQTLNFFDWKCAYCLRKFKGLEHYIPLGLNSAGTTANNCVPSCTHCNHTKQDKHPTEFERLFPTDNIARIKAYFANLAEHL